MTCDVRPRHSQRSTKAAFRNDWCILRSRHTQNFTTLHIIRTRLAAACAGGALAHISNRLTSLIRTKFRCAQWPAQVRGRKVCCCRRADAYNPVYNGVDGGGGGGHGAGGGGGWNGFLVGMMKERMTFHARRGD